jgi:hypothetical protein
MTHKSLFKEAAQRFVQRGQMSDEVVPPAGQAMASQPASYAGSPTQMNAKVLSPSPGQHTTAPNTQPLR